MKNMKNMKKISLLLGIIVLLLVLVVGSTYAFWKYTVEEKEQNVIGTDCLSISLIDESEAITLEKAYPLSDQAGMQTKPYTFTVKNNCDSLIDYSVRLEALEIKDRMDSHNIAVSIDGEEIKVLSDFSSVSPIYDREDYKAVESHVLVNGFLDGHEQKGHVLRVWIDESAGNDSQNKTFLSKVVVEGTLNDEEANTPQVVIKNIDIQGKEIPNVGETGNYVYSSTAYMKCEGEKSVCYIKTSEPVKSVGTFLQTCGNEDTPGECSDILEISNLEANTWYKTKNEVMVTPTEKEQNKIEITAMVCVGYNCSEKEVYTLQKEDKIAPIIQINDTEVNSTKVVINHSVSDNESGIANVTCKYGTNENNLNMEGKLIDNQCILEEFVSNTEYHYAIEARDKVGNVTRKTGTITTNEVLTAPTITGGSLTYAAKGTITISIEGSADSGVKEYEYYIAKTNEIPASDVVVTGVTQNSVVISSDREGPNYIFYRTVSNKGNKSSWSGYQQINIYYKASTITYSIADEASVTNVQEAIDIIRRKWKGN